MKEVATDRLVKCDVTIASHRDATEISVKIDSQISESEVLEIVADVAVALGSVEGRSVDEMLRIMSEAVEWSRLDDETLIHVMRPFVGTDYLDAITDALRGITAREGPPPGTRLN